MSDPLIALSLLGGIGLGVAAIFLTVHRARRDHSLARQRDLAEGAALRAQITQEITQELRSSRQAFQTGLWQTTQTLESKVSFLEAKLDRRLSEIDQGVQGKLDSTLKEGFRHFEKVQEHLKHTELQLQSLNAVGQSIHDLNNLLKLPHLRGSFGEALLERLLADSLPREAFELQYRIVPTSTERVDAVIKSPQGLLPVDSKFPRERVLPLFESSDPETLVQARRDLCDVVKGLARDIRTKYIRPEHGTLELALLFLPSETLYFEVLRDSRLTDELSRQRVFPVSPQTLTVTLHAIALSRQYYEMAKGVERTITEIKKAQSHFTHFERRLEEVGTALARAESAFHTAETHLARYRGAVTRLTGETGESPGEAEAPAEKQATSPI